MRLFYTEDFMDYLIYISRNFEIIMQTKIDYCEYNRFD